MTAQPLEATAYHEAGHAVMAWLVGRPVQKVTVAEGHMHFGIRLGVCELKKGKGKSRDDPLEDMVLILLAGMVAEAKQTGRDATPGAGEDLMNVRRLLDNRAGTARQADKLFRRMQDKTEYLLNAPAAWQAVTHIAQELIEKSTISGRAVVHFCELAERDCDD